MKLPNKHIFEAVVVIVLTILFICLACCINYCAKLQSIQYDEPRQEIHDIKATPEDVAYWDSVKKANATPKLINDGYTQTLTKSGVVYSYNGLRETWYSSQTDPHYRMGEWWCDSNGFWRTTDGYFVVAYTMTLPYGTIIDISMGQAMVLDHCPTAGTVDAYVNWEVQ